MKALALTSAVLTAMLAIAVGWFSLRSDPLGGEPNALVAIDSLARPTTGQQIKITRNGEIPKDASAAQRRAGATMPPVQVARNDVATTRPEALRPPAQSEPQGQQADQARGTDATVTIVNNDVRTLPPAPDNALIESSRYGKLPRIAANGQTPSRRYARPSAVSVLPRQGEPARIAILINGMGLSEQITTEAIAKLPGQVTLAFSPYGRNLQEWVRRSRADGHEVMLQIPLEPFDYPDNDPGPQTLLTGLTPEENLKRLLWLMGRFTGYIGVTNHMGAKFAAAQNSFLPVLEELRRRGLVYVDDGTSSRSTAGQIARDLGLGFSVAHVQLDAGGTPGSIEKALQKLESIALENGHAIGVGTSLPATIEQISTWAAALERKGIILIPVSAAVNTRQQS